MAHIRWGQRAGPQQWESDRWDPGAICAASTSPSPSGPVLAMFDDPIELIDREETCRDLGGISQATLYRGVNSGRYPRPVHVGPNTVRWIRAEVKACKIAMMASRGGS
jgi:predicted DNA-binding transcriptional regulator AlpA